MTRALLLGALALLVAAGLSPAAPETTTRVSVSSSGEQGNFSSYAVGISSSGRYAAFTSDANNLVAGDTNGRRDAFVHDRTTGRTTRVSVSSNGRQAACSDPFGCSDVSGISDDGRYVAFVSNAPNLVAGDTNHGSDVFVHDLKTKRTSRVSVSSSGRQAKGSSGFAAFSRDGRYVAFASSAPNLVPGDTNHHEDVFVHDRKTGRTSRVSVNGSGKQGNGDSEGPAISAGDRYVAFTSLASNLIARDTNGLPDVFVHDLRTGKTWRVSVSSSGAQATGSRTRNGSNAPAISADGRYLAFHSDCTNLVAHDTNGTEDIFVHDRKTGRTTRVSVSSTGAQANDESLGPPVISADGRHTAFASLATNLVANDANDITDVFLHDLRTGRTTLVSLSSTGEQGNDGSFPAEITPNNRDLTFTSYASNLVPNDTNRGPDAFVRVLG